MTELCFHDLDMSTQQCMFLALQTLSVFFNLSASHSGTYGQQMPQQGNVPQTQVTHYRLQIVPTHTASLASRVECETIDLWLWSFCVGARRFSPRPWHYSRRSFSSGQLARFSPPNLPYIQNSIFIQNQSRWGSCKLQTICLSLIRGCQPC